MIIATRVFTALFALIALVSGAAAMVSGLGSEAVATQVDNNFRFFAGVWMAVGIGLAFCVVRIREATMAFRILMLTIFVGGIGRLLGVLSYEPERRIVVAIAIELVLPVVLIAMQARFGKRKS